VGGGEAEGLGSDGESLLFYGQREVVCGAGRGYGLGAVAWGGDCGSGGGVRAILVIALFFDNGKEGRIQDSCDVSGCDKVPLTFTFTFNFIYHTN